MIGLYCPYIHFRDENWLKLALIYWSRIARIVPETYWTRDSDDVRRVQDELGAVIDSVPGNAGTEVDRDFISFVRRHAEELRRKYDVARSAKWKENSDTRARAPYGTDPRFGYIYHEKLGLELSRTLANERLAVWGEGRDMRWIGVHPDIAAVYMTCLAESIAGRSGYGLLADSVTEHVVVGERSIERLAQMLLKGDFGQQSQQSGDLVSAEVVAVMAIQAVLPRGLAKVPMTKIIELRKRYLAELADFQAWIHGTTKTLREITGGVTSRAAVEQHLAVIQEQQVKPRLDALKEQLRSLAIETVSGAFSVKSPWPIIADTTAALYRSQPALAVGGIALSAIPNVGKQRREARKAIAGNPAAYLLHAQERLAPKTLVNRVSRACRRLALGV